MLKREGIPPTIGRIIMGNVYRQFVENANYNSSTHSGFLQNELNKKKEKENEIKENTKEKK